jgi:hypothetical protein
VDSGFPAGNVAVRDLLEPTWAAALGALWLLGRIIYFVAAYISEPAKRFPGFFIQSTAAFALLLGALGRIVYLAV